jgi:hypothetical protein
MIFFDTESCGLTGPLTLLQTKRPGQPPELYYPWKNRVSKTLLYLEALCDEVICAFNLTHDWFHVNKFYNLLWMYKNEFGEELDVVKLALLEKALIKTNMHAQFCLKPKDALDLFLYARTGPLQRLMIPKNEKSDVTIKRVPKAAVKHLIPKLPQFDDIYTYYRAEKGWQVTNETEGFVDLIYRFSPSMGLKPLYSYIFKRKVQDYPIPRRDLFDEKEYRPWGGAWPGYMPRHLKHWDNPEAIKYATNDVIYLEELWEHWDRPGPDVNSRLACQVGASRWRGFSIDIQGIKHEINGQKMVAGLVPFKDSPERVKKYILSASENPVLDSIRLPDTSKETLINYDSPEARQVVNARRAEKRINTLNKLLESQRFFPAFRIVGTKSNRMSGTGGLNPQGIAREETIRQLFKFYDNGYVLSGGDFKSFEVAIADAVYNDNNLHQDLCSGRSIHGILGAQLYQLSYEEIVGSEKEPVSAAVGGKDYYHPAKNCVFAMFYGAHEGKLAQTAGIDEDQAKAALKRFMQSYPNVKKKRDEINERFQPIKQPGGIGTEVVWGEPDDYVSSLLGFRRYFTLENSIIKALFHLATTVEIPVDGTVTRRDREQTIAGATRTALYACVFNMQQRNMRAANNHVIQATGAELCKRLQDRLWTLQEPGVNDWQISLFNVHDEVMCVHIPEIGDDIKRLKDEFVEEYKSIVPLLAIDWKENLDSWADK